MTPVKQIILLLGVLCTALLMGVMSANAWRDTKHVSQLLMASREGDSERVIAEYHRMPEHSRTSKYVLNAYENARAKVGDRHGIDLFPNVDKMDAVALLLFLMGTVCVGFFSVPRNQHRYAREESVVVSDSPTESQLNFIRHINGGVVPVCTTRESAVAIINRHLERMSERSSIQRVDISPQEFLSVSQKRREEMKIVRERKCAQEKLRRQEEQKRLRDEHAKEAAKKAEKRLYARRSSEEERLIRAREARKTGICCNARSPKAAAIQELQNLVNDILADKKIEPQEVRQLKAWLLAHKQAPTDFDRMIHIIDKSLEDGIIDEKETQELYEGVIDCLLTIRDRTNA